MQFVRDTERFQTIDDCRAVLKIEAAIKKLIVRFDNTKGQIREKSEQPDQRHAQANDLPRTEFAQRRNDR